MHASCPECEAPLGGAEDCRELFHELPLLEARVRSWGEGTILALEGVP